MNRFKVVVDDVQYLSNKILNHKGGTSLLSKVNIHRLKTVSSMTAGEKTPNSYVAILQNIFDKKLPYDVRKKIIESNKKRRQYKSRDERDQDKKVQISIDSKTRSRLKKLKKLKQYKSNNKEQSFDYVILKLIKRSRELVKLKSKK